MWPQGEKKQSIKSYATAESENLDLNNLIYVTDKRNKRGKLI